DRSALGARARAGEAMGVASLARRGSHRAPQLHRAATIGTEAPGPSFGDPPRRLPQQAAHRLQLVPAHLAKIALAEQFLGAVAGARRRRSLDLAGDTWRRKPEGIHPRKRLLGIERQWPAPSRNRTCLAFASGSGEEEVEGGVEDRALFAPGHEHSAKRVADLVRPLQVDGEQRLTRIANALRAGCQPCVAKQTRKERHALDGVRCCADHRRALSAIASSLRSRSSWCLIAAPMVSRNAAGVASVCPSAASARAQSTVSATPGTL